MADFSRHDMNGLIMIYNDSAREIGRPEISQFNNKEQAIRRTSKMYDDLWIYRGRHPIKTNEQDPVISTQPQDPVREMTKRRGRPPGSKNKNRNLTK